MKYFTIFLLFLVTLGLHDYFLYQRLQRKFITDLNNCILEDIKDAKKENPNRNREYFENHWESYALDCHNTIMFKYMYPKNIGILVYDE